MTVWAKNRKSGMCGRCGQAPPVPDKSRCQECADSVNAARKKWDEEHPSERQANKNAYWKSEKGLAAIKRRRKKWNKWRRAKRAAAKSSGIGTERSKDTNEIK